MLECRMEGFATVAMTSLLFQSMVRGVTATYPAMQRSREESVEDTWKTVFGILKTNHSFSLPDGVEMWHCCHKLGRCRLNNKTRGSGRSCCLKATKYIGACSIVAAAEDGMPKDTQLARYGSRDRFPAFEKTIVTICIVSYITNSFGLE